MERSRRKFFDKEADTWEEKHYPDYVRVRLKELIDSEFLISEGLRVLDVGAGTGILIPFLIPLLGPAGIVCSFDLSFPMTRQAKLKLSRKQDQVLCADVHHIPFRSNVFDRVICFAAFPHFNNPELALREMSRVLKVEGKLIIAHLLSRDELARHHSTAKEVSSDLLPEDKIFIKIAEGAGCVVEKIIDRPGRFVLRAKKLY